MTTTTYPIHAQGAENTLAGDTDPRDRITLHRSTRPDGKAFVIAYGWVPQYPTHGTEDTYEVIGTDHLPPHLILDHIEDDIPFLDYEADAIDVYLPANYWDN